MSVSDDFSHLLASLSNSPTACLAPLPAAQLPMSNDSGENRDALSYLSSLLDDIPDPEVPDLGEPDLPGSTFILPEAKSDGSFSWSADLIVSILQRPSGVRPSGALSLTAARDLPSNALIPVFGAIEDIVSDQALLYSFYSRVYAGPSPTKAINGWPGLRGVPVTTMPVPGGLARAPPIVGNSGLSIWLMANGPHQVGSSYTNSVLLPAPADWSEQEEYRPLRVWLETNWLAFAAATGSSASKFESFPLSFLRTEDQILANTPFATLINNFDYVGRMSIYSPPPLFDTLAGQTLALFRIFPGNTMYVLNLLLDTPEGSAYKEFLNMPIQARHAEDRMASARAIMASLIDVMKSFKAGKVFAKTLPRLKQDNVTTAPVARKTKRRRAARAAATPSAHRPVHPPALTGQIPDLPPFSGAMATTPTPMYTGFQ